MSTSDISEKGLETRLLYGTPLPGNIKTATRLSEEVTKTYEASPADENSLDKDVEEAREPLIEEEE